MAGFTDYPPGCTPTKRWSYALGAAPSTVVRVSQTTSVRHAVRVLLVDEQERLLLFRSAHELTGDAFWFPAGGGLEDGEDVRAAAVREVAEETGLADLELGPEVWHRRHVFSWRGERLDQRERWFLARVDHFDPEVHGWTEDEKEDLTAFRWWSLDELEAAEDTLVPRNLPLLLSDLLRHGPPPSPIEVSA